jgi:hypothetical protein
MRIPPETARPLGFPDSSPPVENDININDLGKCEEDVE